MTNEEYHANTTHISKSGLDLINRSPAHYYTKYLDPGKVRSQPTEAMRLGTAVHAAILEPHEFAKNYFVLDDTKICFEIGGSKPQSTNKYRDWKAEMLTALNGKIEISSEDYVRCLRMRDSVHSHGSAKILLEKGVAEQSIFWNDRDTGAPCKIRPDWLSQNTGYIVDPKTTEDASFDAFMKSIYKYRYHVQAPYYMDGYLENFGQECEGFAFIAVEKTPPYAVAVYYITSDMEVYRYGKLIYKADLKTYAECLKSQTWEAYGNDILPVTLPGYAKQFKNQ